MIVHAARSISAGSKEEITLGDIKVMKEWTFAGDVALGIITLLAQDEVFETTFF
jgi:GDPmannose 4,6-dehydratase